MPELTKAEAQDFQTKATLFEGHLVLWVVQRHTEDGERYVGVPILPPNLTPRSEDGFLTAPTLEALRELLPAALTRIARGEADHPSVIESWFAER